jgi:membrane-associated phospholipid phosphatase
LSDPSTTDDRRATPEVLTRPPLHGLDAAERATIMAFGAFAVLAAAIWVTGWATGLDWQGLGLEFTAWAQDRLAWMTPLMELISRFTDRNSYIYLGALLYWSVHRRTGLALLVAVLVSTVAGEALKMLIASPRPGFLVPDLGYTVQGTFGIPSGHVTKAVVVWGLLAAMTRRRPAWVAALAMVLAVSASRLHLGAHFPADVFSAWIVGGVVLVSLVLLRAPLTARLEQMTPERRFGAALALSAALLVGGWLSAAHLWDWEPPARWAGFEEEEVPVALEGLDGIVLSAGVVLGLAAGDLLAARRRPWARQRDRAWPRQLGRGALGLAGLLVFLRGVAIAFPPVESPLLLSAIYLQGILVGAWITGLARVLHPSVERARYEDSGQSRRTRDPGRTL